MRRLLYIPIIHTSADLGSLSALVQTHYAKVCGKAGWNQREELVEALWSDIEANLDALRLDARKTRIYQDGLPVCGFEERIVRELAKAGSSNHQLILRWLDRGAVLMGTEDAGLLLEEYELQKRRLPEAVARNRRPRRPTKRWIGCSGGAMRSSPSESVRRFSRARRECCSSAPCIGSMRSGPPIFAWKRSATYTKLYGGHGPKIAYRTAWSSATRFSMRLRKAAKRRVRPKTPFGLDATGRTAAFAIADSSRGVDRRVFCLANRRIPHCRPFADNARGVGSDIPAATAVSWPALLSARWLRRKESSAA